MEKIIDFNWTVTPADSKKHIVGSFNIDKPYKKLVFNVSYDPKFEYDEEKCLTMMHESIIRAEYSLDDFPDVELRKNMPLANHISWSIDSPLELLGTKHKHNPNQVLEISNEESTYGFKRSPIYEGTWRITASLTAILTEEVNIKVEIEGMGDTDEVD